VGLWALACEKPLVTIDCFQTSHHNIYKDVAVSVRRIDDLTDALRRVVKDQNFRINLLEASKTFLKDHLYALNGKASERIARIVTRTMEQDEIE